MNTTPSGRVAAMPRTPAKGLMSLKSASAWLDLRDTRVTMRLVREGKLKALTIGRRVYITTKSLNEFVA